MASATFLRKAALTSKTVPISVCNKVVYALPAAVISCSELFYQTYQTKFYVDDVKMTPGHYALYNALVRSADLFSYLFIGWFVDNFFVDTSWLPRGRRRPLFVLTSPFVAASLYLLFVPPRDGSPTVLAAWYLTFATIYHVLPLAIVYYSLGAELSSQYDEQASVFGYAHVGASVGRVVAALVPGILIVVVSPDHRETFPEFTFALGVAVIAFYWFLAYNVKVPRGPWTLGDRGKDGCLWEQPMFLLAPDPADEPDAAMGPSQQSLLHCFTSRKASPEDPAFSSPYDVGALSEAATKRLKDAAGQQYLAQWIDAERQGEWDIEDGDTGSDASSSVASDGGDGANLPVLAAGDVEYKPGFALDTTGISRRATGLATGVPAPPAGHAHVVKVYTPLSGDRPLDTFPVVAGVRWGYRNRALRSLVVMEALVKVAAGIQNALAAFYVQYVLQPQDAYELWLGVTLSVSLLAAATGTPFWVWLSTKTDQRTAWLVGMASSLPAGYAMYSLGSGDVGWYCGLMAVTGFTLGGSGWLLSSLRAAAIDYDNLYLGMRREAQYVSYINVPLHWLDIPCTAFALAMMASAGYDPNATVQPEEAIRMVNLLVVLVPTSLLLLAFFVGFSFPLTRHVHEVLFGTPDQQSPDVAAAAAVSAADAASGAPTQPPQGTELDGEAGTPHTMPAVHFHTLATPAVQRLHALQRGGKPVIDPLTQLPIRSPACYRAASLAWLLDHFSFRTLGDVLLQRQRQANDPDAFLGVTVECGPVSTRAMVPTTPARARVLPFLPSLTVPVVAREIAWVVAWTLLTALALWGIVSGLLYSSMWLAVVCMLLFGLFGLLAFFHALRIKSARELDTVTVEAIQRYFRVHGEPLPAGITAVRKQA